MNVKNYVQKEMSALLEWVYSNKWLSDITVEVKKSNINNLSDTDCLIKTSLDKKELLVEIKIENSWPLTTKNLTLDAISAFQFKKEYEQISYEEKYKTMYKYDDFVKMINIDKLGTAFNSKADIILKKVEDTNLLLVFNNHKLQSDEFHKYLKENCKLKANPKDDYNIEEDWESAFFIISLFDETLNSARIIGESDLEALYKIITSQETYNKVCPHCKTLLIKMKSNGKGFWGCPNFTTKGCPGPFK